MIELEEKDMKNVYILGSKGLPSNYGGFETFVDNLVTLKTTDTIKYHVSCWCKEDDCEVCNDGNGITEYNGATSYHFKMSNIGPGAAILYDIVALNRFLKEIDKFEASDSLIYILACRIGPFIWWFKRKAERLGVKVLINPDGHEWKRQKWPYLVRKYWKLSERLMVKHADLLVCDNVGIEDYIKEDYRRYNPKTTFIAYGASTERSTISDDDQSLANWMDLHQMKVNGYYLIVGRFVPENNYETMIAEFLNSNTDKDLIIITNVVKNKFYNQLQAKTDFESDNRVKFVGTVYDKQMLMKIRENAYAYIHGHEVGGTNPSLLEALASTKVNILLDVSFNQLVGKESSLYFSKESGSLKQVIEQSDHLSEKEVQVLDQKSYEIIRDDYSWEKIVDECQTLFLENH